MSIDDSTLDEDALAPLFRAGAAAIRFNAPLGAARAREIGSFVSSDWATAVDLGCGYGALAVEIAAQSEDLTLVGIDTDAVAIEAAIAAAKDADVGSRVRFEVGDAAEVATPTEVAICVAASHAFGDTAGALKAMRGLGTSAAVFGDMVWTEDPGPEHIDLFGEGLPRGEDDLADLAIAAGWTVAARSSSSLEEWDEFEHGWIGGVRAVGSPAAEAFATERSEMYNIYRGVAGFAWLHLTH